MTKFIQLIFCLFISYFSVAFSAVPLTIMESSEDYINSANNAYVSTASRLGFSAEAGFAVPFVRIAVLAGYAGYLPKSDAEDANSFLSTLNSEAEVGASVGQHVGNWFMFIGGFLLNPICLGLLILSCFALLKLLKKTNSL